MPHQCLDVPPTSPDWFERSDNFTVTVTDDEGGTTDQLVSITVNNVDDAASISGNTSNLPARGP